MHEDFWVKLAGAGSHALLGFLCGLPQCWGNLSLYMYSYFFDNDFDNDFGLMNFAMLIELVLVFVGFLVYQIANKRLSSFILTIISVGTMIICLFLSSITTNPYLFMFFFNGIMGFALGLIQSVPFTQGVEFFNAESNKTQYRNFLLICPGFNPFIFNFLAQAYCNPANEPAIITDKTYMYFHEDINQNFPGFIRLIAIIYTIVGFFIIMGLFITRKYRSKSIASPREILIEGNQDFVIEKDQKSLLRTLFSREFLKLFCMAVFSSIWVEYFLIYYKEIAFVNTNNDKYLSALGACAFLCFNLGRVFWKLFSNIMKNLFLPLTVVIIVQSLVGFLFKFAAQKEGMLFIVMCLVLFIGGGQFSLYEKLVRVAFRESRFRKVMIATVHFAFTVSLLLALVAHFVFFENIGYNNLIIVMTLLGFLTFIFFL